MMAVISASQRLSRLLGPQISRKLSANKSLLSWCFIPEQQSRAVCFCVLASRLSERDHRPAQSSCRRLHGICVPGVSTTALRKFAYSVVIVSTWREYISPRWTNGMATNRITSCQDSRRLLPEYHHQERRSSHDETFSHVLPLVPLSVWKQAPRGAHFDGSWLTYPFTRCRYRLA